MILRSSVSRRGKRCLGRQDFNTSAPQGRGGAAGANGYTPKVEEESSHGNWDPNSHYLARFDPQLWKQQASNRIKLILLGDRSIL